MEWGPAVDRALENKGEMGNPEGTKPLYRVCEPCGRHLGTGYPDGSFKGGTERTAEVRVP